jgi:hypothetical protein
MCLSNLVLLRMYIHIKKMYQEENRPNNLQGTQIYHRLQTERIPARIPLCGEVEEGMQVLILTQGQGGFSEVQKGRYIQYVHIEAIK